MIKTVLKLTAFFCASLLLAGAISLPMTEASYSGIYEKTVRLHVLAASDSAEDQQLKLLLRDALLLHLSPLLEETESKEEAEGIIRAHLSEIEEFSRNFLLEQGCTETCSVVLGKEYYPTRVYENCSYPAGEYTSLRVFIGAGEGKNWWCVVYPPLCLSASKAGKNLEETPYTEEEKALLLKEKGGYRVRFALLDLGAKLKELFASS